MKLSWQGTWQADSRSCPSASTLTAFLGGRLDSNGNEAVQSHLQSCSYCAAAVDVLGTEPGQASLEEEEFAASLPSARPHGRAEIAARMAAANRRSVPWQLIAAGIAGVMIVSALWVMLGRTQRERSIGDLYAAHRPFAYKFTDAPHGPVAATRGGSALTEAPLRLLKEQSELARQPGTVATLADSGRVDALLLQLQSAREKLQHAHELKPDDEAIANDLGAVMAALGQKQDDHALLADAVRLLGKLILRDPANWTARWNRGLARAAQGRNEEAAVDWRECLREELPQGWRNEIAERLRSVSPGK